MEGIGAQKDGRKSDNDEPAGTFFLGRRFRTTTGTAWAHETTENSENALWTKNMKKNINGQIVLCFKVKATLKALTQCLKITKIV